MLKLKQYQDHALTALTHFLQACRTTSIENAFKAELAAQNRADEPYQAIFGDIPSVCLRIPTGGGKTLMAAHAVALAGKAVQDSDTPVALWLTPSDMIRTQTMDALSDVRHPYRQAMAEHFGDKIQVCDLESLQTVSPHDIGKTCIVVVATIQSFNVTNTAKRNVYSFFEELAPHFDHVPTSIRDGLEKVSENDLESQPYLTIKDVGRIKHSVANWLHMQRPIVIVDEAHNNRTHRFFKTLGRLNPGCVIELTATPVPGNNVLYHVSAQELKTEEMIKLPIVLAEHPGGWRECLQDAILTRNRLELLAQKETDYVRPIALIQAESANNEATVSVVRQHLVQHENIPEEQIAIATGSEKELEGIDLFDRACKIRYVITIAALREGWDCSFAYVLASLQSMSSSTAVEQLLGRVLRMPYAKARQQDALNKAYTHIVAESFAEAAGGLKDRMVQNMGFERLETASIIVSQQSSLLPDEDGLSSAKIDQHTPKTPYVSAVPDFHIQVNQVPDTQHWPDAVKAVVKIRPSTQGATLLLKGTLDTDTLAQAEAFISQTVTPKIRESVKEQFQAHRAMRQAMRAPAQLGLTFALIPQLCLELDGYLEVVEKETLTELGDWDLLDQPVQLAGFAIHESINSFEIDVNGEKVKYRHIDAQQLKLNDVISSVNEQDLVRWLDTQTRKPYISQRQLQAYLVKMMSYLIHDRGFTLTALVRARFQLAQALGKEIERLRQIAMEKGFQGRLIDMTVPDAKDTAKYSFRFEPGKYPARLFYQGSYEFNKHFYPTIHDLREKTDGGRTSEEFLCAQAIDAHAKVKLWVRNIERQPQYSFWLPTSNDYFYPDFVAELVDGRVLVVEYKGKPYETNDDSREKRQIGEQWEKSSNGRCLFLFAVKQDEDGRSVHQQLADKLTSTHHNT